MVWGAEEAINFITSCVFYSSNIIDTCLIMYIVYMQISIHRIAKIANSKQCSKFTKYRYRDVIPCSVLFFFLLLVFKKKCTLAELNAEDIEKQTKINNQKTTRLLQVLYVKTLFCYVRTRIWSMLCLYKYIVCYLFVPTYSNTIVILFCM